MIKYTKHQKIVVLCMLLYDTLEAINSKHAEYSSKILMYYLMFLGTHGGYKIKTHYVRAVDGVDLKQITIDERNYLVIDIASKLLEMVDYRKQEPIDYLNLLISDFSEGIEYADEEAVFAFADKIYKKCGV